MKKRILCFFFSFLWIITFPLTISAQNERYSWYCTHVKNGEQPPIGGDIAFVEELGGYYLDRRCAEDNVEKVIYLTFDAGYENGNIAKILDILKEEEVPAAFFILGHLITEETELVKRMQAEGHLVCNHTVHHRDMSAASDAELIAELEELEALYRTHIGGELAPYYRPPEGRFSRANLKAVAQKGYATVFWSFAYPDWDNDRQMSPEKARSIILDNLHNGEVMLLHPTSATNAAVLQDVIREAKNAGYRFGTLDELVCKRIE